MEQKKQNFPSALEAVFLIIFLMGIELLISLIADGLKTLTGVGPEQIDAVIMVLANAVLFTAVLHHKQLSYRDLFHPSNQKAAPAILLLALPILLILPALELSMDMVEAVLEEFMPLSAGQEHLFDEMLGNGFQSVVTGCIVAPVLEEMLFRGIILRSFLCRYSRWRAIWGSSMLFGLAHMNIYQFVGATLIGAFCGWLYERTRSLWPGIFLHGSSNAVALYLYQKTGSAAAKTAWELSDAMLLIVFMLAGAGILLLRRWLPISSGR